MEERIEDNESYERRDCLVFSGAKIPPHANDENCISIIQELARNNLKISIPENEISVAHNVGTRNPTQSGNKRSIIAKFCRRNTKMDVLSSARKMKIENLFVNESLTPQQRTIGYVLRRARRDRPDRISGSTTVDGKHYVWIKPVNSSAPASKNNKLLIGTIEKLRRFTLEYLEKPLSAYIDENKLI